jgi:hypothetical protein
MKRDRIPRAHGSVGTREEHISTSNPRNEVRTIIMPPQYRVNLVILNIPNTNCAVRRTRSKVHTVAVERNGGYITCVSLEYSNFFE